MTELTQYTDIDADDTKSSKDHHDAEARCEMVVFHH
jgi:hypothetical protein